MVAEPGVKPPGVWRRSVTIGTRQADRVQEISPAFAVMMSGMLNFLKILDKKRRGLALSAPEINLFVCGVSSGAVTDAQLGAFTMAVRFQGMDLQEQTALTLAMRDSGSVLKWQGLDGPVLDKHSTGGVGDWVSLVLAPLVAAAGAYVPMISGRGLGHTGGTLDKLESIPGFSVKLDLDRFSELVSRNGLAMIGQGPNLAPADGRMYAVRDVCGTVSSMPLIVASILSKKLAEGLDGLVLDVKTGNGATISGFEDCRELASEMCQTARSAGVNCHALISDMNQPLGWSAGNALEVKEAIDFLTGKRRHPGMFEVTLALATELLFLGGLFADRPTARAGIEALLENGSVAERFAIMVEAQGGPVDLLSSPERYLPRASVVRPVNSRRSGWIASMDTRALGMAVIRLGGGRIAQSDTIDPSVGFDEILSIGDRVSSGQPLCVLHASSSDAWDTAADRVLRAITIAEQPCQPLPVIYETIY